jgi:hypothetical protein
MTRNLLLFTSLLALSACSIQFDSQYGIRIEPAKIEADAPRPHSKSAETWNGTTSVPSEYALEVWSAPSVHPVDSEPQTTAPEAYLKPFTPFETTVGVGPAEHEQTAESENVALAAAAWPKKKPERNMTVAWVLWAIPAALVLFAASGLLLNFGAHWYYLGYRRKGMSKTIVWAITLAVFSVVVFLSSVLGMNLLAGLLAFILLVPLAVIQIIGLVKDFFALQKIANKKARGRKQRIV